MKRQVSIRQALQRVADGPPLDLTKSLLDVPAHELVSRTLFEIANGGKLEDPRTLTRANTARTLIFNRLVGKRKTGTHPATRSEVAVTFVDLAGKEVGP